MSVTQSVPIDIDRKIALLSEQPCFAALSFHELQILSSFFTVKNVTTGQIIVKQESVVDSIYIIVKGAAEVQHETVSENKKITTPVAKLNETEAIGVNDLGLYSQTGVRTATVTALTDCILLRLDLQSFLTFARENENVDRKMRDQADLMLRMKLIKSAAPFTKLTTEKLRAVAQHVLKKVISAGEIIFNKGEAGNACYLIKSGKIEIFSPAENLDDKEHRITFLKPPAVFGEGAILSGLPRNASARAIKTSELFELNRELLRDLLNRDKHFTESLGFLSRNRARPKRFPHIEIHKDETNDLEPQIVLKDPINNNYYRLSPEGYFIWQKLDGQYSLRDIVIDFHKEYDVFDPQMIAEFVMEMEVNHFVERSVLLKEAPQKGWKRWLSRVKQFTEAAVTFENVDQFLLKTYQKSFYVFFTVPTQLVLLFVVMAGMVLFVMGYHPHIDFLKTIRFVQSFMLILGALLVSLFSIFLHELAHAYTTKKFGHQVKCFGVGWYWLGPVAYCDTSEMWLSTRWRRFAVDVAGIYMDLFIAGLAAIMAYIIENESVSFFLWFVALSNYLNVFAHLSPMMELDGYYVLMDLLGRDNLRAEAMDWMAYKIPKTFQHPRRLFFEYRYAVFYWIYCFFYFCVKVWLAYWVMSVLLNGLFGIKNLYLALLPSVIILIFSSLSVWAEIQAKRQLH